MIKSTLSIGVFLLLINSNLILNDREYFNNQAEISGFKAEDIELKDDAFHNYNDLNCVEWWYFDATLNDGYSIQIILYVFVILNYKVALTSYEIFKDGVELCNREKFYLQEEFYTSPDTPIFIANDKTVMRGYINKTTGEWIYDLSLDINNDSIELQFIGSNKGCKGKLDVGSWAVILPNADVKGKINVNTLDSEISGYGYHDHNWDMKLSVFANYGWYWGRVIFENYSVVYYIIMDTRVSYSQMVLIVFNESSYSTFKPNDIHFLPGNYQIEDYRLVPLEFEINANNNKFSLQMYLKTLSLHHGGRTFGIRNYWRYFIDSRGYLNVDSDDLFLIDGRQISEYKRFR